MIHVSLAKELGGVQAEEGLQRAMLAKVAIDKGIILDDRSKFLCNVERRRAHWVVTHEEFGPRFRGDIVGTAVSVVAVYLVDHGLGAWQAPVVVHRF